MTSVDGLLMPGYSTAIGLETISVPDAVMVRRYRELTLALNLPYPWFWGVVFDAKSLAAHGRALDLLDVKYVFSTEKLSGLELVDSEPRVSIYRRDTAWPRAFFTDKVETFDSLAALAQRIREGAPGPFVAVDHSDGKGMSLAAQFEGNQSDAGQVVSASDYALTTNTTSFTVAAPAAGVVYLGEVDVPGDFEVSVNGRTVPYFTANYAFKAVTVPGPGTYRISFRYWPAHLSLFLAIAGAGAILWLAAMVFFWLHLRRRAASFATGVGGERPGRRCRGQGF